MAGTAVEVAPIAEQYPALVGELAADIRETIADNLGDGGMSSFDLQRVKIPGSGGRSWEVLTLEGVQTATEIEGIITYWQSPRSYWVKSMEETGGGDPPDCASPDGKLGIGLYGVGSDRHPSGECETCPMNQFGTKDDGSTAAKPCGEQRLIFLLRPGDALPVVVQLPPTSMRKLREYMLLLAGKGIRYYATTTKFTLDQIAASKGRPAYSVAIPAKGTTLSAEEREAARSYGEMIEKAFGMQVTRVATPDASDSGVKSNPDAVIDVESHEDDDAVKDSATAAT